MSLPVRIENDAIRMEVWPQFGGKVTSIIDKADRFELLFTYPAEIPSGSEYAKPYQNGWYAGWDECFPAIAPGPYPAHPYDGIPIPDHGELWGLPTTAVPTKDGITTVWHGLRFGYRLTRKLYLDDASIRAQYSLVNLAPFDFHFVWAMHALMSLTSPAELDFGQQRMRFLQVANSQTIQDEFAWPLAAGGEDFSKPLELPANSSWKMFSTEPISTPAVVRYPQRSRSVKIGFARDGDPKAFWGIFINTGRWLHHRHFALEPTTGRFDQLDRSIRDGSAGKVAPSGRAEWNIWLSVE